MATIKHSKKKDIDFVLVEEDTDLDVIHSQSKEKRRIKLAGQKSRRKPSAQEILLSKRLKEDGFPKFVKEYKFHPKRRWLFDFAWPSLKVGLEYEGLSYRGGKSRHTTFTGYTNDCEKYNEAALLDWIVLRATAPMVKDGSIFEMLDRAIAMRTP